MVRRRIAVENIPYGVSAAVQIAGRVGNRSANAPSEIINNIKSAATFRLRLILVVSVLSLLHRYRLGQVSVDWIYDPRNERVLGLADEFREDCSFPFSIAVDG